MTKNTARSAKTAIACALASALTLGSFCAPALAQTLPATGAEPAVSAQSSWHMSEGEAVFIARTFLGFAPDDIYDVECDPIQWGDDLCYEVEFETWPSHTEYHVIVDVLNGNICACWSEM